MIRRSVSLILCLLFGVIATASALRPKREIITGRIAAYQMPWGCINGNEYWSMVIHVQHAKRAQSAFVRVDFSLPCGNSPEWISAKPTVQKFHLIRTEDCDEALDEFIDFVDSETKQTSAALPRWHYPSGEEHEMLPFNQVVPCYRSTSLPLMPVL